MKIGRRFMIVWILTSSLVASIMSVETSFAQSDIDSVNKVIGQSGEENEALQ